MRTVHKYALHITDDQTIQIQSPAIIRSVQAQRNKLVVWAEVETESTFRPVHFCIRGTDHPMKGNEAEFVGTVQIDGFVWHVYKGE